MLIVFTQSWGEPSSLNIKLELGLSVIVFRKRRKRINKALHVIHSSELFHL